MDRPLVDEIAADLGPGWTVESICDTATTWALREARTVATLTTEITGDSLCATFDVEDSSEFDPGITRPLVAALVNVAPKVNARRVRLDTSDLVARNEARRLGFEGLLRGELALRTNDAVIEDIDAGTDSWTLWTIQRLLPSTKVTVKSSTTLMRRFIQHAISGTGGRLRFDLTRNGERIEVLVPQRRDLVPEVIAMAADTGLAIKDRFGSALAHVRSLSFDLAAYGMSRNRVAGSADFDAPGIHINAGYCCADLAVRHQTRVSHRAPPKPSATTGARFIIDKVIAHEFGHQFNSAFQSRDYEASIEFRRQLGEMLGVATIEKAIRGDEKGADSDAARAWQRLADDVSPYATTNLDEAMAELFSVWWFEHPDSPAIIKRFDRLIEYYFPIAKRH